MVTSFAHVCWRLLVIGGVFRLSCSLLISVACIPVLPRPRRLMGLFRSPLSCNCPSYSQRIKTCFGCAMILTTGSDNIPYMIHLLHLQLSDTTIRSLFYFTFTDPHAELSKARVIYFSQKSPVVGLRSPIYGNGYSCNNKSVLCTPLQGETS